MQIEIKSTPHRLVPVSAIQPNPHRNLNMNPIKAERVEELISSFERTGFWDNIVVRPFGDKYQLAYGHNRLAALKDPRVKVDAINIPVADLNDWEMYCAMVDENEMQGGMTPQIVLENVNVGCDLIERALTAIGPKGTWAEFNAAIGKSEVVPVGTTSKGRAFEQVRDAFFRGEGLGRGFLAEFLPCGHMRKDNIVEVLNTRYGAARAAAQAAKAEAAKKAAAEKKRAAAAEQAKQKATAKAEADRKKLEQDAERARREAEESALKAEKDAKKAAELRVKQESEAKKRAEEEAKREKAAEEAKKAAEEQAAKLAAEIAAAEAEVKKFEAEAARIGDGVVVADILLRFPTPLMMTDFTTAIRKYGISKENHAAAATYILEKKVHGTAIGVELDLWWDKKSGAEAKRRKTMQNQEKRRKLEEDLKKRMRGVTYPEHLYRLSQTLLKLDDDISQAIKGAELICEAGMKSIEDINKISKKLNTLIERTQESFKNSPLDVTPITKVLTHQEGL